MAGFDVNNVFEMDEEIKKVLKFVAETFKSFDEVTSNIVKNLGLINKDSQKLSINLLKSSTEMQKLGISMDGMLDGLSSTQEAFGFISADAAKNNAILVKSTGASASSMAKLQVMTQQVGDDFLKMAVHAADLAGVGRKGLMEDIANAADETMTFMKGAGENIARAASYAKLLGTNLGTVAKFSEDLVTDFQGSIEKSFRAQVLLGRNININVARRLAYEGDIEGAHKMVLEQMMGEKK